MVLLKSVLAANIKACRKSQNLTQENLAEMVDTAPTCIAMIESGRHNPSFKMIERIAEVLKVDAPELFSMKNYPAESSSEIRENLAQRFVQFLKSLFNIFTEFASSYKIEQNNRKGGNDMRAVYPSGITREQFSVIEYDLKPVRKVTHPRK